MKISYRPVGEQLQYYNHSTRFSFARIGRQWGKTKLTALRLIVSAIKANGGDYWWVAPTTDQAKIPFRRMQIDFKDFLHEVNKTEKFLKLFNGAMIFFKGSDDPENLRGESLGGVVLDEFATMRPNVWSEIIRPMLSTTRGWADIIGTPKGKNHFFELEAQAKTSADWSFIHLASNTSPFFSRQEFDTIRQDTPEQIFRQEYLAEYVDAAGEVFKNFRPCIKGEFEPPQSNRRYTIGVDLAKMVDFTVISVWDDERKHLVHLERFNKIDWSLQENKIVAAAQKYNNATVIVDATGTGDPVYERLRKYSVNVKPVKYTTAVKSRLISALLFAIEKRDITFPHHPDIVQELSVYSAKQMTNHITYGAPSGYHDDIVDSFSLAVEALTNRNVKINYGEL